MGKYLDKVRKIEKCPAPYLQNLQNQDLGGSVGSVGTPYGTFEKIKLPKIEVFTDQGVRVLPEDLAFIHRCLPIKNRDAVIDQYVVVWLEGMKREPMRHKKDNAGRFAANSWIRGRND
ncbi:MAG: hypothetical protein CME39_03620 [Haliea sp.]|nr:hypothetical protein [Haliea sp.]|tara:strand:- start:70 stop:423 length:354 start_codon:yes stop_codon:yes gene_type:complete